MHEETPGGGIVVGVDGSEASIAALREARRLGDATGQTVLATAFWEYPQVVDGYVAVGIGRFEDAAAEILQQSVEKAFGPALPDNVVTRLVRGHPRPGLIEASRNAGMVVVGRRGHGGFGGLLLGSVSSACVAHAHCPVLVVHAPETEARNKAEVHQEADVHTEADVH